jgi:hypothetical protein
MKTTIAKTLAQAAEMCLIVVIDCAIMRSTERWLFLFPFAFDVKKTFYDLVMLRSAMLEVQYSDDDVGDDEQSKLSFRAVIDSFFFRKKVPKEVPFGANIGS